MLGLSSAGGNGGSNDIFVEGLYFPISSVWVADELTGDDSAVALFSLGISMLNLSRGRYGTIRVPFRDSGISSGRLF